MKFLNPSIPQNSRNNYLIGFIVLLFYYSRYLIFSENSFVTIHDALDSEYVYKVLIARYPNNIIFDNIMFGLPSYFLTSKISITQLYFYIFKPFHALIINDFISKGIAFHGTYLLLSKYIFRQKSENILILLISIFYSLIPFYSLLGIVTSGLPLLLFSLLNIYHNNKSYSNYFILIFFAFYTSFTIIGFFCISILLFINTYLIIYKKQINKGLLLSIVILTFSYLILDNEIFKLFFSNIPTHRNTWLQEKPALSDIIRNFYELIVSTQYHTGFFYTGIIILSIILVVFFRFTSKESAETKILIKNLIFLLLFFIVYKCLLPILRYNLGNEYFRILNSFQSDRFYFFNPLIWLLLFSLSTKLLFTKFKKLTISLCLIQIIITLSFDYNFTKNIYISIFPKEQNKYFTYKNYFDVNLFDKVKSYINLPQNDYKIVNIGISPSITVFNGFRNIDAYQNAYPLSYKAKFRSIISKELDKNPDLKKDFDNWGSRAYIFSNDLEKFGRNYKDSINIDINTFILKSYGCKYIFSSNPIINYKYLNIKYLNKFSDINSTWKIYLYGIN